MPSVVLNQCVKVFCEEEVVVPDSCANTDDFRSFTTV